MWRRIESRLVSRGLPVAQGFGPGGEGRGRGRGRVEVRTDEWGRGAGEVGTGPLHGSAWPLAPRFVTTTPTPAPVSRRHRSGRGAVRAALVVSRAYAVAGGKQK